MVTVSTSQTTVDERIEGFGEGGGEEVEVDGGGAGIGVAKG